MAPSWNRRPGFSRRAQYGLFISYVIAVIGALIAAALLALSSFNPPAFAVLRGTAAEITLPFSAALTGIGRTLASIPAGIGSYLAVHDQNRALRQRIADTDALLMRARSLSYENHRLKALLQVRERAVNPVVTARLVGSTASSTRRYAVLNAGYRQGVREGQPVRGSDGLIGRVVEVGLDTARVLLLSDPESVVPIRRTRDGLAGFAAGRGDGLLDVRAINLNDAQFLPGDVIVTSGAGGIYPPEVPVARITSRGRDTALARPLADSDTLDYALVQHAYLPPPPASPEAPR